MILLVFVLCAGCFLVLVAASPDPKLIVSGLRLFGYALFAIILQHSARITGAWRRSVPYRGRHSPVWSPTRVGRWIGLLCATITERAGSEPAAFLLRPIAAQQAVEDAGRIRRALSGATWAETDVHRLCKPEDVPPADLAVLDADGQGVAVLHYFDAEEVDALLFAAQRYEENAVSELADAQAVRRSHLANVNLWRDVVRGLDLAVEPRAAGSAAAGIEAGTIEETERTIEDDTVTLPAQLYEKLLGASVIREAVVSGLINVLDSLEPNELTPDNRARLKRCIELLKGRSAATDRRVA